MPIVYPQPAPRQRWYNDLGELQGATVDKLLKALLASQGGFGSMPTNPSPGHPGTLTFPTGASTRTSPDELAQIQRMGGVPSSQGGLSSFTYNPPTKFGLRPDVDRQIKEAQLQKIQQDLDPNSPMNQVYSAYAKSLMPGTTADTSTNSLDSTLIRKLAQLAHDGDEEAIAMLRKLGAL